MTATLLEIVKLMEIFDMKIVEIKFVEIVTEGKFVEINIRRNKMTYSIRNYKMCCIKFWVTGTSVKKWILK